MKKFLFLLLAAVLLLSACGTKTNEPDEEAITYEALLKDGTDSIAKGNYGDAIDILSGAVKMEPTEMAAYEKLAKAYEKTGNEVQAAKTYAQASDVARKIYKSGDELPVEVVSLYKEAIAFSAKVNNMAAAGEYTKEILSLSSESEKAALKEELALIMDDNARYQAYYDLLTKIQKSCGTLSMYSVDEPGEWTFLTGLAFARLLDFDNDGNEELLTAYNVSEPPCEYSVPPYVIEIYSYNLWDGDSIRKDSDRLEVIYSGTGRRLDGGTTSVDLKCKDDVWYLLEGAADSFEHLYVRSFNSEGVSFEQTIHFEYGAEEDPYAMIDNQSASLSDCVELMHEWTTDSVSFDLSSHPDGSDTIPVLIQTLQRLEDLAGDGKLVIPDVNEVFAKVPPRYPYAVETVQDDISVYDLYKPLLKANMNAYTDITNIYFLTDINNDGTPELLLCEGTCEADFEYAIYTIANESAVYLGSIPGSHTNFYQDEYGGSRPYIYHVMGMMGFELLTRVSIEGGYVHEEIIHEEAVESYYSNPYEIPYASVTDDSLLTGWGMK